MTMILKTLVAISVLACCKMGQAQGTKDDYERALNLRTQARGKLIRGSVEARWSRDGTRFWYRNKLAKGASEFVVVEAETGKRTIIEDGNRLVMVVKYHLFLK